MSIVNSIIAKIFGTPHERYIKNLLPIADQIESYEAKYMQMDDSELAAQTELFKSRIAAGETLDQIAPEAIAVSREACDRRLGMLNILKAQFAFDLNDLGSALQPEIKDALERFQTEPEWSVHMSANFYAKVRELYPESVRPFRMKSFRVQLLGGLVLHNGCISEMSTGEGKTLTAAGSVYLNALSGKGVHVVTVNDYLASRDAQTMGLAYRFLGLTVGLIIPGLDSAQRRLSYGSDVTYGTNNEFGFDYLRDNMATETEDVVQRDLNFCIVDEVDSILIDEARTPLIISGPSEESNDRYVIADQVVRQMKKDAHFTVDEKARNVLLTDDGVHFVETALQIDNLYGDDNAKWVHHLNQGLKAHSIFNRDVDYVVEQGEIVIIDENTGRKMNGRRYSEGLHQALEAKEKVEVRRENQTLATITFQNFFRLYNKLSGMTGTADTEAREFSEIYRLRVVSIPTHRPCIRHDENDFIYRSEREKLEAAVKEIKARHEKGQPVLVGTISIEKSEKLAVILEKEGIPHDVLNAKNHANEAEIILNAGQKGRVTIATNMAGRGTDIVLGEGVAELGGLHVLATERHESRRIDNQLRGRSGRQGDPGSSQYFLSLDDDLMRIFGGDRIKGLMERMGAEEGEVITHPIVNRAIANAQKRVEGQNFESRKHLLDYDDVMNQQRKVIYGLRKRILHGEDIHEEIVRRFDDAADILISDLIVEGSYHDEWDIEGIEAAIAEAYDIPFKISEQQLEDGQEMNGPLLTDLIIQAIKDKYAQLEEIVNVDEIRNLERRILLMTIDQHYKDHLLSMDHLRDAIRFHGYAQKDPLMVYKKEGFATFQKCLEAIATTVTHRLMHLQVQYPEPDGQVDVNEDDVQVEKASNAQVHMPGLQPQQSLRAPLDLSSIGRNDPCWCGSGLKFKRCHGMNS
jgi:preprotein translocase subunit SecA